MKSFFLLMSFMTRIYMPRIEYDEEKLGKGMKFFPVVGAIIGIILYFVARCILEICYSPNLAIVTVILVEIILTGGIHLDGLADTFDGIFSYRSKQKMLEIMKDSRIGTNGVLSLIMYFLLKYVLLQTIFFIDIDWFMYVVFACPIVARLCSVVSCASAPYARSTGMGKTFVDNTNVTSVIIAVGITFILAQFPIVQQIMSISTYKTILIASICIFFIMILVAVLFSKLITKKIGGITGDTLGALLELSQLLFMLLVVFFLMNNVELI